MASKIKVDQLETVDGTGNITVNQPLSGSGAGLTSLPAANLTGSLPAISGASLTGIPAANITGVIPPANLGTGTASSSTFLNGSGAYSVAGGGAWTYITANSPSSTYADFSLSSTYDLLAFSFQGVVGTVDGQGMRMRTSSNAGSSYDSGGSDYNWRYDYHATDGASFTSYNTTNGDSIIMTYGIGTGTVYHFSGILYVHSAPSTSKHTLMNWSLPGIHSTSNRIHENKGFGSRNTASAINGIRFYMNSGNFSGGIIRLYGIANS